MDLTKTTMLALGLLMMTAGWTSGAVWLEGAKLIASDGASGDNFGYGVALDGATAVVGAWWDDDHGSNSGSAYVFEDDGTGWTEVAKLTDVDGAHQDWFGTDVAIDGDTVLVAAREDDDLGSTSGSVFVFVRDGSSWTRQAQLNAEDPRPGHRFGSSVDIAGDTAIIGAWSDDDNGASAGSAYIFTRSGTTWTQQAKLTASDGAAGDHFGLSSAISGDTVIVGAFGDDDAGDNAGSAYVFTRSGTTWTEQAKLSADDGAAGDGFSWPLDISGDTVLIGAYRDDDGGIDAGSAYIFTRTGTTWAQQAKIVADDAAAHDHFGASLSLEGDRAIVGAKGDDDHGHISGSAYLFTRTGSTWTQESKLTASDAERVDQFGWAVAISGGRALVSAPYDDDLATGPTAPWTNSGSAYVLIINEPPVAAIAPVAATECTSGAATVTLDGSASSDPDGDVITYAWSAAGISFDDPTSATPTASFPLGSTGVTLTVTDPHGQQDVATTTVTVQDTLPPTIQVTRPEPGFVYADDTAYGHGVVAAPILVAGALTVEASTQDQCGVAQVDFTSTSGASASDSSAPYGFRHDPHPTASGDTTITATATDIGGHTASASVDFVQVGTAV